MNDETITETFHARDVFDPDSLYSKMRSRYIPELKLRGQFYSWEARRAEAEAARGARSMAAADAPSGTPSERVTTVVVFSEDPTRMVDTPMHYTFRRLGATKAKLLLDLSIPPGADRPPPGTPCRAFLLTAGVVARLCGPAVLKSEDWIRAGLHQVFEGRGKQDGRGISGTLAAVAEIDGEFDDQGCCRFPPFDLPRQASGVDTLPDDAVFVVVIEGGAG